LEKYTYLLVNGLSIIFPLIFTFHKRLKFYNQWHAFWPAALVVASFFVLWDCYFTHIKVWGFNGAYLCGLQIINLPVEEVLFFICIPYACLFTYHVLITLVFKGNNFKYSWPISLVLILGLLLVSIYNYSKLYTSVTFALLAILIFYCQFIYKADWLGNFYIIYTILMIPFFIVNGILTGSFINREIVYYNNLENLGIRILTIPIEDVFYGLLLVLGNVLLYEIFKKRTITK
jgi:lycopene cyclase domain-containing protein